MRLLSAFAFNSASPARLTSKSMPLASRSTSRWTSLISRAKVLIRLRVGHQIQLNGRPLVPYCRNLGSKGIPGTNADLRSRSQHFGRRVPMNRYAKTSRGRSPAGFIMAVEQVRVTNWIASPNQRKSAFVVDLNSLAIS